MRLRVRVDGEVHEVELGRDGVVVDGQRYAAQVEGAGPEYRVTLGGRTRAVRVGEGGAVAVDGAPLAVRVQPLAPAAGQPRHHGSAGPVHPPLPGRVVAVKVAPGQAVKAGQCLVVLEAMKMQNEIPAPADGRVAEVKVKEGQLVEPRDVLVVLAGA